MEGEGGWGEEVDLWKFGGPAESTHRGLLRAKGEGGGVGKNMDETRADPEEIFDLRFRAQDEARTALAFCYCSTGVAYWYTLIERLSAF